MRCATSRVDKHASPVNIGKSEKVSVLRRMRRGLPLGNALTWSKSRRSNGHWVELANCQSTSYGTIAFGAKPKLHV